MVFTLLVVEVQCGVAWLTWYIVVGREAWEGDSAHRSSNYGFHSTLEYILSRASCYYTSKALVTRSDALITTSLLLLLNLACQHFFSCSLSPVLHALSFQVFPSCGNACILREWSTCILIACEMCLSLALILLRAWFTCDAIHAQLFRTWSNFSSSH